MKTFVVCNWDGTRPRVLQGELLLQSVMRPYRAHYRPEQQPKIYLWTPEGESPLEPLVMRGTWNSYDGLEKVELVSVETHDGVVVVQFEVAHHQVAAGIHQVT